MGRIINDVLYTDEGKVDYRPENNVDIKRGMFQGVGYKLNTPEVKLERIYAPWNTLNSHKLTIGTTRQGKSRKMVSDIDQQIAKGENVFIGEPKGSDHQEIIGYTLQSALKHGREKEVMYVSAYHHRYSVKFNPIYRKKNLEIASLASELVISDDMVYKDVGKSKILAVVLCLDFIEQYDEIDNPFDNIIMERMELAKLELESVNSINKYIWEEEYSDHIHGVVWNIKKDLEKNADDITRKKIEEAMERVEKRYSPMPSLDNAIPSRTFLTFNDLGMFESHESLERLKMEVEKRAKHAATRRDVSSDLKRLGSEALREIEKRINDDPTFIKKLSTTFSMALTDIITEEIGIILNTCRINPLLDALTSSNRGAIIIYQPFPLVFSTASIALGRIMFSMFSSMSGYVGASGFMLPKRLYINIDEAGAILSPIVQELSNKGGGLGFTLCLYTQSLADIIQSLDEVGCRILLDNMNTKEFFKVNDNTTANEIALIMGTIKKATFTTASSSNRDSRATAKVDESDIANASIVQRLDERRYLLKIGSDVYIVGAPHVEDTIFKIRMSIPSLEQLSLETDIKREELRTLMEDYGE